MMVGRILSTSHTCTVTMSPVDFPTIENMQLCKPNLCMCTRGTLVLLQKIIESEPRDEV